MINFNRVWAMIDRYNLNLVHSWDRLTDMFYWPFLDLVLWGLTGVFFVKGSQDPNILIVMLTGLVFWIVIWRAQYEINVNLLSEIWDRNIVNIFVSPLSIWEWIIALIIFGFTKMLISISFSAVIAFFLYKFNIFMFGFYLFPIIISLALTGWAAGFVVAGFLIRYGQKVQTLGWAGVAVLAPFTAPNYPISILPAWAQKISMFVPSSYIFEGMREIIYKGVFSWEKIVISLGLNIVYLSLAILFFVFMFKRSRKLGLGRLI